MLTGVLSAENVRRQEVRLDEPIAHVHTTTYNLSQAEYALDRLKRDAPDQVRARLVA